MLAFVEKKAIEDKRAAFLARQTLKHELLRVTWRLVVLVKLICGFLRIVCGEESKLMKVKKSSFQVWLLIRYGDISYADQKGNGRNYG